MKRKWKLIAFLLLVVLLAVGGLAGYRYTRSGVVTVQSGKAIRQDLTSLVTASGEIKPRNYINIGTNAIAPSRITEILVAEGQKVRQGQLLARLEAVQPEAEVAAQRAGLSSAEAESAAAEAGLNAADESIRTAQATVDRAKAELERGRINFARTESLWQEKLIARAEYDQRKVERDALAAALRESESRLLHARAQRQQLASTMTAAQKRISLASANLHRAQDVLRRTMAVSPIDGVVTNLPVRVGETVVPGIQNSPSSLIMTIADMSLITAEIKVDETDIVNVKLDQQADVTIDAIPGRTFRGRVIEIGNTAILRSTGLAASQSTISSQEAKDFKVVVALADPPTQIRPGLSCTAKVITATRAGVLTIPIQALTVRQRGDLEAPKPNAVEAAGVSDPRTEKERKQEIQGVFVIAAEQARFRQVQTGITGSTDIEVVNGIKEGEEIITGSYKVIRTLRNQAKVKVDNQSPVRTGS